ncbi:MAG TPA: nucleotidyltransferase domain-containing protein, partial [Myxococcota bacterium]|nr:nucleotidyltransferase domain-containing protein [Myxococcota bacterium]
FSDLLTAEERSVVQNTKLEGAIYELRKFLDLACQANPNILDLLFCRDEEVRLWTPAGRRLRENAHRMISAKAKHTFSGYATSQLKRIETHRRWLLDPPDHPPARSEFGLPERTVIPADQLAAAQAAIQKQLDGWEVDYSGVEEPVKIDLMGRIAKMLTEVQLYADERWWSAGRSIGYEENFLVLLDCERRYKNARTNWEQYQSWKNNRNQDRAALEAKYGYDTKHGAHLYRLMKMCREILTTGQVRVWRGDIDRELILGIRRGEWSYDSLVTWARAEDQALTEIYDQKAYVVPHQPDRLAVDRLCVELIEEVWRG